MIVETKNTRGAGAFNSNFERILAGVKPEGGSLNKEELSFLEDLLKARRLIQKESDFTGLDALTPRLDQMEEDGRLKKLEPFIARIVKVTPSKLPIYDGCNIEVHGKNEPEEVFAEDYRDTISVVGGTLI